MAKDCQDCERHSWPKDCIGKTWYSYREICWCRWQIIWLIRNLEVNTWPPNPDGSTYVDPQIRTGYAGEGYFVKSASILAELNWRLERCGLNGKLLRAEVLAEMELSRESKDALNYCSGFNKKKMGFTAWKKWRKLYQKVK